MPSPGDTFIENAKALAVASRQPLDIYQVLIEALRNFDHYNDLREALPRTVSEPLREVWIGNLNGALGNLPESEYNKGYLSDRLRKYVDEARADSTYNQQELTPARILWTILTRDDEIAKMLHNVQSGGHSITRIQLTNMLGTILAPPGPPAQPMPPAPPMGGPMGPALSRVTSPPITYSPEDLARAAAAEAELTKPLEPNHDIHIHAVKVTEFLTALGESVDTNQVVIVHGPNGSLADIMGQVLSHRIKNHGDFPGSEAPLQHFEHVYSFSLRALSRWVAENNYPYPYLVLERAKQHALSDKAVLMLNNMQILRDPKAFTDAARDDLIRHLGNRGLASIFGVYHETAADHPVVDATFGLPNALTVDVLRADAAATITFLKSFYYPRWERLGYIFKPDAFDLVVKLEPGIWIAKRRKTLPLAAVALADGTIASAGDGLLLPVAQGAVDALNKLAANEQDAARGNEALATLVKQAREAIDAHLLRAKPRQGWSLRPQEPFTAKDKPGRTIITKEHILEQLFCENMSEFHYPGHAPPGALPD